MAVKKHCKCTTVQAKEKDDGRPGKKYKRQLCWGSWKTMGGGEGGGIVSNKACK